MAVGLIWRFQRHSAQGAVDRAVLVVDFVVNTKWTVLRRHYPLAQAADVHDMIALELFDFLKGLHEALKTDAANFIDVLHLFAVLDHSLQYAKVSDNLDHIHDDDDADNHHEVIFHDVNLLEEVILQKLSSNYVVQLERNGNLRLKADQ